MDILDLLASDNYIPYNRTLAKEMGIEPAILLATLCGYQRHYKMEEFYREQSNIIEDTCLTEYSIRQATKILIQKGLIIVKKKGLPAKNYYKINTKKLIECLSTSGNENSTTTSSENETTCNTTNNTTNNKINNKIDNKINNNIYIKDIVDYLNLKTNSNYKHNTQSTQRLIKARLNEGFTVEDFKKVIDNKVSEWGNDDKMCKYLRPETLFGTKFESYLNTKVKDKLKGYDLTGIGSEY